MILFKQMFNCIAKPITYICNLSFITEVLPDKTENNNSYATMSLMINVCAVIIL